MPLWYDDDPEPSIYDLPSWDLPGHIKRLRLDRPSLLFNKRSRSRSAYKAERMNKR